jgi:hypothetical protein
VAVQRRGDRPLHKVAAELRVAQLGQARRRLAHVPAVEELRQQGGHRGLVGRDLGGARLGEDVGVVELVGRVVGVPAVKGGAAGVGVAGVEGRAPGELAARPALLHAPVAAAAAGEVVVVRQVALGLGGLGEGGAAGGRLAAAVGGVGAVQRGGGGQGGGGERRGRLGCAGAEHHSMRNQGVRESRAWMG